jgi:hypothetical protein
MASQPIGGGNLLTLKVSFLKEPQSAKAITSNSVFGLNRWTWPQLSRELLLVSVMQRFHQGQFTNTTNPLVFVPFSQIEWMLAYSPF